MSEKRKRNDYTKEFKQDAVDLVVNQGYSRSEAGRRLGIPVGNVGRWVREYRERTEQGNTQREIDAEIRRLEKENKRLRMEREILKKAAAFFAKESS